MSKLGRNIHTFIENIVKSKKMNMVYDFKNSHPNVHFSIKALILSENSLRKI